MSIRRVIFVAVMAGFSVTGTQMARPAFADTLSAGAAARSPFNGIRAPGQHGPKRDDPYMKKQ